MHRIRVLHISYAMDLGGVETLIMNLFRHIDRSVVSFDFLLHCPDESAYEKEIIAMGGRIYRIPRYLGYNRYSYEKKLTAFLISHPEYVIIHDHLMDSASETLRIAKKLNRIAIAHSHANSAPFSLNGLFRFFFRKNLWKIADYRFACSEEAGKWLYRGKADFIILKNGIEPARFAFSEDIRYRVRREFGIDESATVIGIVGRLDRIKNHSRLLKIMATPCLSERNTILMITGNGPMENKLKRRAEKLKPGNRVLFTGPRTDVNELLSAMDCFVLPSLSEGLGIALVEAQAAGLPCVFKDTIPKSVDLVPQLIHRVSLSASDETWANTVLQSITEQNNTVRNNAWKTVADRGFDIKDSAEMLQNFYSNLQENFQNSD